jgi:hypothetical protein
MHRGLQLCQGPCVLRHCCYCTWTQAGWAECAGQLGLGGTCISDCATSQGSGVAPRCCRIVRNILADKPRVTKFPIEFDGPAEGEALPVAGDMSESQQQQVGTCVCSEALLICALFRRRNNAWKCFRAVACLVAFNVLTWPLELASAALVSCA